MSASEALVETLVRHDVKKVWGIVGSAFIDPLDLFPKAGIQFIDVQHEQNAVHIADAYARVSGKVGVVMGQNGPGISNMVTGIATAYLNHSPVTVISPQSGTDSIGKLGFQELDQMPMFSNITKYQVHVQNSSRIPELTARAFNRAMHQNGPTQVNIPRDMFYDVHEYGIPAPMAKGAPVPAPETLEAVVKLVMDSKRPILITGYGCKDAAAVRELARLLNCPVATTYLHNDAYPSDDPHFVGSLGYMGSKAAMRCVQEADLVVALGSRLNPFGTTKQYNLDYWSPSKPLVQVDINEAALGVSCNPTIAVHGDAAATAAALLGRLQTVGVGAKEVMQYKQYFAEWQQELADSSKPPAGPRPSPKSILFALKQTLAGLTAPIVTTDIGHCCSQALAYLEFRQPKSLLTAGTFGSCGVAIPSAIGARFADPNRPIFALVGDGAVNMQGINDLLTCYRYKLGITVIVFRNEVWGAELLNQLIWTDARAVGTEIENPPIKNVATAFGCIGVEARSVDEFKAALEESIKAQKEGKSTLIEAYVTSEMGAPFRSDAMRCPKRHLPKYAELSTTTANYSRQYAGTGKVE